VVDKVGMRNPARGPRVRTTTSKVSAVTESGELHVVPPHEDILFSGAARDWRRVRVEWRGLRMEIALTAWEHAIEMLA